MFWIVSLICLKLTDTISISWKCISFNYNAIYNYCDCLTNGNNSDECCYNNLDCNIWSTCKLIFACTVMHVLQNCSNLRYCILSTIEVWLYTCYWELFICCPFILALNIFCRDCHWLISCYLMCYEMCCWFFWYKITCVLVVILV